MFQVDLEQIIGTAGQHAENSEWAKTQIELQLAQLILLAKIAEVSSVTESINKYFGRFLVR